MKLVLERSGLYLVNFWTTAHRILNRLSSPSAAESPAADLTAADVLDDPRFPAYRMSCFAYLVAGLIRFRASPLCGVLLICQSFLSYMSDVHTLGVESMWHSVDRITALITCLSHFVSVSRNPASLSTNLVVFAQALYWLDESQAMYARGDKRFLTAHTRWHICSLVMAVVS